MRGKRPAKNEENDGNEAIEENDEHDVRIELFTITTTLRIIGKGPAFLGTKKSEYVGFAPQPLAKRS